MHMEFIADLDQQNMDSSLDREWWAELERSGPAESTAVKRTRVDSAVEDSTAEASAVAVSAVTGGKN
jgi:hypothetical protein